MRADTFRTRALTGLPRSFFYGYMMPFTRVRLSGTIRILLAAGMVSKSLAAQSLPAQSLSESVRAEANLDTTSDRRWFTARDGRTLVIFALGAVSAFAVDSHIAQQSQRASVHQSTVVANAASAVRTLGDPGVVVLSASTWIVGVALHRRAVADAGLHTFEATLVSGAVTGVLKGMIGRARPYVVHDSNAFVFHPFRVNGAFASFPSGHTTVAFAAASATAAEVARSEWARRHRGASRAIATALFGVATAVGVSRVYHDAHWTSDVIAGAGIGTVTGTILVRAQHTDAPTRVDRWLLPRLSVAREGQPMLQWHAEFR